MKTCEFAACPNTTGSVAACPLSNVGVGCHANVVAVGGDTEVRRRLLEMGFCNGAPSKSSAAHPSAIRSSSVSAAITCPSAMNKRNTSRFPSPDTKLNSNPDHKRAST